MGLSGLTAVRTRKLDIGYRNPLQKLAEKMSLTCRQHGDRLEAGPQF